MGSYLTAQHAEALSETAVPAEDAKFLRNMAELLRVFSQPAIDRISPSQGEMEKIAATQVELSGKKGENFESRAKRLFDIIPAQLKRLTTIEKMAAAMQEHASQSDELLGDFAKKLKKWTIFVLPEFAEDLKSIPFALFRIDDFSATTVMGLPSGGSAVAINHSFRWMTPFLSGAFADIYNKGTSVTGTFQVRSSASTTLILELANALCKKRYDNLVNITRRYGTAVDVGSTGWKCALFAALHECGHILLAHKVAPSVTPGKESRDRSKEQEFEADLFAVNALLNIEDKPNEQYLFEIAVACTIVFGFSYLVNNNYHGVSHPSATYRWTAVRPRFVAKFGNEVVVKRLEFIIESLATMQQLPPIGGESDT